jgi:crossover junction endodeoxyribonuclease RuvC
MLALGIDPGTARVGYGLVRELDDGTLEAVHYGVITTPPEHAMAKRLQTIYEAVTDLVKTYKPGRAAVEHLFFGRNVTTAIHVAQGRGVILLALAQSGIPFHEFKPSEVKQTVSGYGNAGKPQVQEMVRVLLGLEKIPKPDDAADALAIAITELNSFRYAGLGEDE